MQPATTSRSYNGSPCGYASTRISATWISCAPACLSNPRFTWIDERLIPPHEELRMSDTRKRNPSPIVAAAAASRRQSPSGKGDRKALPLSALDLVPLVEGGTSVAALQAAAELAQAVDRFGYTRLWYAEHHNMPGIATTIPEILIAHVGSMTTRIRLGAGGVMLPNHSPLQVAESYKLLEAIYPGRIDLGIGRAPGTDALTALALRRSRKALTADDFLEQLGELIAWGSGTFPPDNPFRAVRAMPDDRPLPPLYLLGSSTSGAD